MHSITPESIASFITEPVAEALMSENAYCEDLWESQSDRAFDERSIDEWILYMSDYIGQARHQAVRGNERAALHTIRKIVNLGLNAMKQHGAPVRSRT